MDFNLPLILLIAVAVTGGIWLYDIVFLRKKRVAATAALAGEFDGYSADELEKDEKYQTSLQRITAEPVMVEYAKSFFPVLFLVFFLRSFIVEPFQIPSESMVPSLEVGDFILVNKFEYGIRLPVFRNKVVDITEPERGDVMVFFPPNETRYFIKRVIGLPGDIIQLKNNVLYVNGSEIAQKPLGISNIETDPREACIRFGGRYQLAEETLGERTHTIRKCAIPGADAGFNDGYWVVPQGEYFMMGDNRDNSSDSRVFGTVPEGRIVGKAFAIWMHWESFLSVPEFSRVGTI